MSKPPKLTIDERLTQIRDLMSETRRAMGLKQTSIADAMALSNSQYSRLESGSTEMTLRQFLIACEEMHLNPANVLGAQEEVDISDLRKRLIATETKLATIRGVLGKKDAWDD